jgi:hypothetical protein
MLVRCAGRERTEVRVCICCILGVMSPALFLLVLVLTASKVVRALQNERDRHQARYCFVWVLRLVYVESPQEDAHVNVLFSGCAVSYCPASLVPPVR